MIITRTPFRVSFFGGGTDYPAWFREHGGGVLATTIDKYAYISCRALPPFFEHKTRVVWSEIERVNQVDEIKHPSARECLRMMEIDYGVEIHHDGDLPARTGLGSSSAFTVGLLNALNALEEKPTDKLNLARAAITVERDMLKENVGVQDQIITAIGGFNRIDISTDGDYDVRPLEVEPERLRNLQDRLLLYYTGLSRYASDIAGELVKAVPDRENELKSIHEMVELGADILTGDGDLSDFGRLLHEAWQIKRHLTASISNDIVNDVYDKAMQAGASGGKLLGAGGGGFVIFFVEPEATTAVKEALSSYLEVPFEFESHGSEVIFNNE